MAATRKVAWVTGASGFIGGYVRRRFIDEGWTVVAIDRARAPLADARALTAEIDDHSLGAAYDMAGPPQAVFHGAGTGAVGQSVSDPKGSRRDTVDSTAILLDVLARDAPLCRVVFPSSATVYGATDAIPLREDRERAPMSLYGEYKVAAEDLCKAAATHGQSVAIFRMFSVYGAGLRKQLPWELGRKLLIGTGPVELCGTGTETRDFFAVTDAARAIVTLASTPQPSPVVVNGGTGIATTVATFAQGLAQALKIDREIRFNGQVRAGDPQHFCADVARMQDLGMAASVPAGPRHRGLCRVAQDAAQDLITAARRRNNARRRD